MIVILDFGCDGLGLRGAELEKTSTVVGLLISRVAILLWWFGVTLMCKGWPCFADMVSSVGK